MRVCHTVISFLGLFHLNLANSLSCEALESLICLEDVSLIKDCVTQVGKTWKRDAGLVVFLADSPEDILLEIDLHGQELAEATQVRVTMDFYKTGGCRVTELFTWVSYQRNGSLRFFSPQSEAPKFIPTLSSIQLHYNPLLENGTFLFGDVSGQSQPYLVGPSQISSNQPRTNFTRVEVSVVGANFNMKYLHPEGIEHFHTEAGFLTSEAGLITYAAVGGGALVLLVVLIPVLIVIYFRRWMLAKEAADLHPNTGGNQAIRRLDNPPAPANQQEMPHDVFYLEGSYYQITY